MPTWDEAFEKAQQLSDRCDAFFERREAEQRRKDAKRVVKRDGDDPLSNTGAPVDFREDSYSPEERSELRQGALSKVDR
jgi:hypothetical protein